MGKSYNVYSTLKCAYCINLVLRKEVLISPNIDIWIWLDEASEFRQTKKTGKSRPFVQTGNIYWRFDGIPYLLKKAGNYMTID